MSKLAIVVIGYNRIPGMLRLLDSLERAEYDGDRPTLIVSLDHCGDDSVVNAANAFQWTHGEKRIRTFPERQGLRKHILACGDFLEEFDAIAVLEDDLVVSPAYYGYMKQAVDYYRDSDRIAGISLYSHKINVNANAPFVPQPCASDVFFLKFAQSWGQIWLKKQWFEFKDWYGENKDLPIEADNVPAFVSGWPKSSWLKYHIKYCIDRDKYFVYPYHSLSTCFSDVGEHCKEANARFQVPMMTEPGKNYLFTPLDKNAVVYDAFFEREHLGEVLRIADEDLCTDLYGTKGNKEGKRYWLSVESLPYKAVSSYALEMRPHECNVINSVAGNTVFLYDTWEKGSVKKNRNLNYESVDYYFNITVGWRKLLDYIVYKVKRRIGK
ncbi:MAG: hypothetical protein ACI3XR_00075 [Eubacteriales bacterium]